MCIFFGQAPARPKPATAIRNPISVQFSFDARRTQTLTDEEPHVRPAVQLLAVHLAQHAARGHHVEQADDNPGVLAAQISHRIGRIGEERLARDDLDGGLLAAVLQVLDRLRGSQS